MLNKTIKAQRLETKEIAGDPLAHVSLDVLARFKALQRELSDERTLEGWSVSFGPHDDAVEADLVKFRKGTHTTTNSIFRAGQFYQTSFGRFIFIDTVRKQSGDDGELFHIGFSVVD